VLGSPSVPRRDRACSVSSRVDATPRVGPHARDVAGIEEALGQVLHSLETGCGKGPSSNEEDRRRKAPRVRGTRVLFAEARGKRPSRATGRSRATARRAGGTRLLQEHSTLEGRPGSATWGVRANWAGVKLPTRAISSEEAELRGQPRAAPDPKLPGCILPREGKGVHSVLERSRLVLEQDEAGVSTDPAVVLVDRIDCRSRRAAFGVETHGRWVRGGLTSSRPSQQGRRTSVGSRIEAAKPRDRWRASRRESGARHSSMEGARGLVPGGDRWRDRPRSGFGGLFRLRLEGLVP